LPVYRDVAPICVDCVPAGGVGGGVVCAGACGGGANTPDGGACAIKATGCCGVAVVAGTSIAAALACGDGAAASSMITVSCCPIG
jgi:hypothetical protein